MRKKAFALRIDEDVFKGVDQWAKDEYRSVNGQIEWMLKKTLKDAQRFSLKEDD